MLTVNFKSPRWIGFVHFVGSLIFSFLTLIGGTLLSMYEISPFNIIFGFFFATITQTILTYVVCFGVGTSISMTLQKFTRVIFDEDRARIVQYSTYWFFGFWVCIILFLYLGDQTPSYGVTPREELYSNAMIAPFIIIEYYVISQFLLMRKKTS